MATILRGDDNFDTAVVDIGDNQTWQDLIGSRSVGVTYTNTSGRSIAVVAGVDVNANNATSIRMVWEVYIDGVRIYRNTTLHTYNDNGTGVFIVPNGSTYRVNTFAPVTDVTIWMELR